MPITHHPLKDEFQIHQEYVHNLKTRNLHFQHLINEYDGTEQVNDDYL